MDLSAAVTGLVLVILGLAIAIAGVTADTYLHRGVETGDQEPFVIQPTGDALATNIDLRLFFPGELQDVADALETSGFSYVRQPVSWAEIEPEQGTYDWSEMDQIVNELARREIEMVAVVRDAPDWSRDAGTLDASDGPPVDPSALGAFMQEFTARYGTAVPFVQVWEEPNNPSHWGGRSATPATFLPYLAAAHNGARAGNPGVQIITPELSWKPDPIGERADLDFLAGLYDLGAEAFFDIVGIQLDGGMTSPDDRRISATRHNFSRAVLVRELMLRHEDAATPVWATSLGWARSDEIPDSERAEFVARALERSWIEWPWMGLVFQWSFFGAGGAAEGYALVNPDGTATELYRRLTDADFQERIDVAETGFLPMDAPAASYSGAWEDQHLENRTFRTTSEVGAAVTIHFVGTGALAVMRIGPESGNVIVEIDGERLDGGSGESGKEWDLTWSSTDDVPIVLASGLDYGEHTLTIRLAEEGSLTLGGIVIERQQPFVWPVVMLTTGAVISLFFGIRSVVILIARRSDFLPGQDDRLVGRFDRSAGR